MSLIFLKTEFRFSRGQKEIIDLILSHELIKNNIFCHFWKEGISCG